MIKLIKNLLYKLLSLRTYLKLRHTVFFILYDIGWLKKSSQYKYHYFVRNLISEGDCVIDIGAHLGYFSRIFSRLIGKSGTVVCIEPIPVFFYTLQWVLRKTDNTIIYNCFLGEEEKKTTMVLLPKDSRGQVQTSAETDSFTVDMKRGSSLLKKLPKINYIRCNIKGYEEFVLPEMKDLLQKHHPILQVETQGKHKEVVFKLMQELEYIQYTLYMNTLIKNSSIEQGDYLFIHKSMKVNPKTGRFYMPKSREADSLPKHKNFAELYASFIYKAQTEEL